MIVYDGHVNANISTWFHNETLGKFAEVVTEATGNLCEKGMVFTKEEIELKRDGQKLTAREVNNLFAYWHGAGHKVTRLAATRWRKLRAHLA